MPGPDALAALAADLGSLSSRQRREVLGALRPFERARVEALIEEARPAARTEASSEPDFGAYSPWLARRLRETQSGSEAGNLTPSTRRLLAKVAADGVEAEAGAPRAERAAPPGRSLVSALGGLLSKRRQGA